ncbi:hypothetical protein ACHAPT_009749 [Fusarium lateritium]
MKTASPIMKDLERAQHRYPRYGQKCPQCKARIVGRQAVFQRHIDRHAKLVEVQEINSKTTIERAEDPGFDVALVRDMFMSTPAKFRHTGGAFKTGPLAGKGVTEGLPKIFFDTGRIRKVYEWVKRDLKPPRFAFRALQNTNAVTETIEETPKVSRKRKATSPVSPI